MPEPTLPPRRGLALRAYLAASHLIGLIAPTLLRRRLARGKEDPARFAEKLGQATLPRPTGRLIWLNAVGLGEVLALRGLIAAMSAREPDLQFLITSSAQSSAQVMAANLPPNCRHQYLPLDAPRYLARFLDHWQPDLLVWAEQEIWPGAVLAAHARGIPQAMVNARISAEGFARRKKAAGLLADTYGHLALIAAQDAGSAQRLQALGVGAVQVTGSLKSSSPALAADPETLAHLQTVLVDRRIWVAASTHPGDEAEALAAQATLRAADPAWLLVLVPRDAHRRAAIGQALTQARLPYAQRSAAQLPGPGQAVWLADSYGELGLWYRLAETALIGGGFDAIGGHNPWEAACLNTAVLHGPDTANFADDYALLASAAAARQLAPGDLAAALQAPDLPDLAARAAALSAQAQGAPGPLAGALLSLIKARA